MVIHSRKENKYYPSGMHTKYKNTEGNYVPSVTNIIKVIPKDALIYWANSLGWKRKSVRKELEEAANIGTCVHNYIEKIIKNDKDLLLNLNDIERDIRLCYIGETRNALLSFLEWYKINRTNLKAIDIEKSMSGDFYGGTCDMICKYDNKLMIFDFKTSGEFYFSMFVQLAAYVRLYENETNNIISDVAVLRMDKKNGNTAKLKKLSDIKNGDIDFYYYVFEQCLNLYRSIYLIENDWKAK